MLRAIVRSPRVARGMQLAWLLALALSCWLGSGHAVSAADSSGLLWSTMDASGQDQPLQCRDGRGREIPLMKVGNLGDVGRAWYVNSVPVIAMDPQIANRLPDKLVRFFFNHECAHHVLGHWYFVAPDREKDADCWAITRERDRGTLTRDEIIGFAPFLSQSRGSPWGHLPGAQRVQHMLFCFDKPLGG